MGTLKAILIAIAVYIAANELLDALVLGTSVGDTLINSLVPIALAIATVWIALKAMD
jgi:hypothetical protein